MDPMTSGDGQRHDPGMEPTAPTNGLRVVPLRIEAPLWTRFFSVAPLVLVGTKEGDHYDIAPKHMAMPLAWKIATVRESLAFRFPSDLSV